MITNRMTYKEIYDNLEKDRAKIGIKIEYLRSKAIKELRKKHTFPACVTYSYKIPSTNNEHIIYFYAESRFSVNSPEADSFFPLFDKNSRYIITYGKSAYKAKDKWVAMRSIVAHTNHFFDRYNERFLKQAAIPRNELIEIFLSRSKYRCTVKMNDKINRNYEKYGLTGKCGYQVRDGFCFVNTIVQYPKIDGGYNFHIPEAIAIVYKTFTATTEMYDTQTTAINEGQVARKKFCLDEFGKDGIQKFAQLQFES